MTSAFVRKREFTRGIRGYREEEVDHFLNLLAVDMEALMRENAALKDGVEMLTHEIERYRSSEKAMIGTLEAAKALMADISVSAEKRAEIVLKNAELDAERLRREARESVQHMTEEAAALSRRWELFSARFRSLVETELDRFNSCSAGILLEDPFPVGPIGRHGTVGIPKTSAIPIALPKSDKTFKSTRPL